MKSGKDIRDGVRFLEESRRELLPESETTETKSPT